MVGPDDVSNAVTLNSVVVNAARVIGPAVGGLIIATVGIGECFVFNGASYAAVVIAMVLIRPAELHPSSRSARRPGQIREGFRYAWSQPALRTTIIMLVLIGMFTFEFSTTLPMLAEFTFGAGSSGLAIMTSLMGAGAVVGGLVVAATGAPTPRRVVVVAAAFGATVLTASAMPTIGLVYLVMPFVGVASVSMIALSNATLQLNSDPQLRGRVMALFSMSLLGTTPIGGPIVGWIGDQVGARFALVVGAIAAFAAAGFGYVSLRRAEMLVPAETEPVEVGRGGAPTPQPAAG